MPVVIPARFNGPPDSGNGGYACAVFAEAVTGSARGGAVVTLRTPPPLEIPLMVEGTPQKGRVIDGVTLVAEVASSAETWPVPPPVAPATALECQELFQGREYHPFPTCFVCGTERPEDDGLALEPGPVPGRTLSAACLWHPDPALADASGRVGAPLVWAALDCPGAWTLDLEGRPMVLGRMNARVAELPRAGEPHVIAAASEPPQGRKVVSRTALYTAEGTLLASASAVWITLAAGGATA